MKTTQHFNQLTEEESEALAILSEECAEVIQIICKIQRHGLDSFNPNDKSKTQNWQLLAEEIGHVDYAKKRLFKILPVDLACLSENEALVKEMKIGRYLHHGQP